MATATAGMGVGLSEAVPSKERCRHTNAAVGVEVESEPAAAATNGCSRSRRMSHRLRGVGYTAVVLKPVRLEAVRGRGQGVQAVDFRCFLSFAICFFLSS